ncbi:uncharacterized protein LOC120156562 [Hibiscus syriacus]|uniref:uncharacterized protein LOC120156562 n=1 Tax=Hibiscus syriacus TaxID=106335 RepID=UPI0019238AA9|nr:uncharacterized protein LOC120156562 [Hibiscus syriacus]
MESISRDCDAAISTWLALIRPERPREFLAMDLAEWIRSNLSNTSYFPINGFEWDLLFGSLLWCLWTRWNKRIFETDAIFWESILSCGHRLCVEAKQTALLHISSDPFVHCANRELVSCKPHPTCLCKINTDGAHNQSSGLSTCGGVIHDSHGNWVTGFTKALG